MKRHLLLVGIVVLFSACDNVDTVILVDSDGQELQVRIEIADTPESRQRGLMFREELPDGYGMLFVFDDARPRSFWMKNTLIPLDIMFFDKKGMFVSSATMDPCREDPCKTYTSFGPAKFALEVAAGSIDNMPKFLRFE